MSPFVPEIPSIHSSVNTLVHQYTTTLVHSVSHLVSTIHHGHHAEQLSPSTQVPKLRATEGRKSQLFREWWNTFQWIIHLELVAC